jgi:hypothetical protein
VAEPRILVGASIPRSGHHFLQQILVAYFGPGIHYCEFYGGRDCCRTVPCTRRGRFGVIYQKNHDHELELSTGIPGVAYVIQYRHPVPEALSDRELDLRDAATSPQVNYRLTREHYAWWLARKAVYYRRFHDKWIAGTIPGAIRIDYDRLTGETEAVLAGIIRVAAGSVDAARVARAIEECRPVRATAGVAYKPRVLEESPDFDRDLLGAFEDHVLRRCPHFGFERRLDGRFEDHPLQGLVIIQDETEPLPEGCADRLAAAEALAGGHPEVQLRLGQREQGAGDAAAALARLERLLERHPFFVPAYGALFDICRATGLPVPASILRAQALLGVAGDPDLLVELGRAWADDRRFANATLAFAAAAALKPRAFRPLLQLALALERQRRWREALHHAEAAEAIQPENEALRRLLERLRQRR